ncbi:hypothetical protein Kpol_479p3 [Vanderwaltozyma polyspora DSM 70294]|uniref:Uncharacterized protein n=1 Tax=Vanderwaltozyma polyspora (strain ATCC 22028 / DSM 70294 / BCRC 21397 / CBS 2163 / NBRC 10782 / NRRL Y-8283 / UCD 57-17) TaxID=436907 RepID=A7TQB6_VANPO|nr:uncharacterized protein Kpol_479p3 [Vanderwaltozyma polyspora DSM 70294]EDO15515.1 hypothetical protein Kpol_479p3 [Vanderwaltozyma polyspora DSM 70294]
MDSFPTTPVNKMILGHQETSDLGSTSNGNDGEFKVHPHGLSSKKRFVHSGVESASETDLSLDCVRRSVNPETSEKARKEILDNMDINKLFSKSRDVSSADDISNGPMIKLIHSPVKVDLSSPVPVTANGIDKAENEEHVSKKPRLELDFAPDLKKPITNDSEEIVGSPDAIEMIETKSSPNKTGQNEELLALEIQEAMRVSIHEEESEDDKEDNNSKDVSHKSFVTPKKDDVETSPNLHKLTPLLSSSSSSLSPKMEYRHICSGEQDEIEKEHNGFILVSRRNEELIDQLHMMNKRLNNYLSKYENSNYQYKLLRAEHEKAKDNFEKQLNLAQAEVDQSTEDANKHKERFEKIKKKLSETKDEIQMLNQNQRILQDKYDGMANEVDEWRNKYEEVQGKMAKQENEANNSASKLQLLEDELEILKNKLDEYEASETKLKLDYKELDELFQKREEELFSKANEVNTLQQSLNEIMNSQKSASEDLVKQIEELSTSKSQLEVKLSQISVDHSKEKHYLEDKINGMEKDLSENVGKLEIANQKISDLQIKLNGEIQNLANLKKEYEVSNDDAEINKAEVQQLNTNIEELKESEIHLKEKISTLEANIEEWKGKYQAQSSAHEKVSIEFESLQLKNNNIEAEHLAELEQLHDNMTSLQDTMKENAESINKLKDENRILQEKLLANEEVTSNSQTSSEVKEQEINELKNKIKDFQEKLDLKEQDTNKRLKLLAEDLYVQYSSKHEQKVKLLKKGYDTKYQSKIDQISLQNQGLVQEIEQIKNQLSTERKEKQKLLELLDQK